MTWEKFTAEQMPINPDGFARMLNEHIAKNNLPQDELLNPPKELRGFCHDQDNGKIIISCWNQNGSGMRLVQEFHAGRTYEFDNFKLHCGFDGRVYQVINEFQMFPCCVMANGSPPETFPYPGTDDLVVIEKPE